MMASALATRIAEEHAAAGFPEEVVSRERRRTAIQTLESEGLPTTRDENWKYANLRPLDKVRFAPRAALGSTTGGPTAPALTTADLPGPVEAYARYTFVDGLFAPELSSPADRSGISVILPGASSAMGAPGDARFALLNDAFAVDGITIRVAAATHCPTCVELVFVASIESQAGSSYPRVELHVERDARVGLIERHVSAPGSGPQFVNAAVKVDLARGATVSHYRVQQAGAKTIWFDTLSGVLAQDATYKLHGVSVGGQSSRSTINVRLAGQRASASVSVASLGDRQQIQDTFVLIEHAAPDAKSEQTFRGISAGRARVAFNGKVVVRKEAHGTDSQQSLRGLLAGPEAEIDVRPQLEIYTDDVRCAHGATAGKLDDNMLFYLLSRGIDRATALRLLKWAFLEDVVARIEVPELRRQIERTLAGQMHEADALQEFL